MTGRGRSVVWIVGFRVDEASEPRRVQPAKFSDPETGDQHWRPFVELRYGLADVRRIMAEEGVAEPDFYEWTTRSGCVFCFYKPRRELAEAAKRYPETFERMAAHEEAVIAATAGQPRKGLRGRADQPASGTARRGASPWVVTRGGTLREIVAGVEAQGELDIDERRCGDPLGTCVL